MNASIDIVRSPLAGGVKHRRADTFGTVAGKWVNTLTGQGLTDDRHTLTSFAGGQRLATATIDALIQSEPIARRIVMREPDDAMREGYTITVDGQPAPELDAFTQGEITRLREDQERYQRRVTEHFQTTAVLVGD